MTGPKAAPTTSRGQTRPWVLTEVLLFDAPELVEQLRTRGVKLGAATSVQKHEWEAARVYPEAAAGARLTLSDTQRKALKLFAQTGG